LLAPVYVLLLTGCSQLSTVQDQGKPAAARTYVYDCESGFRFIARSADDTVWLFLPTHAVQLPRAKSVSGEKYSGRNTSFSRAGASAVLQYGQQIYRRCRNNDAAAVWEHARLNGVDFRAAGKQPGWSLELTLDDEIVFVQDRSQTVYRFPTPTPEIDAAARKTTYLAESSGHQLTLSLEARPCTGSASAEPLEVTVRIKLDDEIYQGCGMALH
jgi:uncharacterized membrane protein